MEIQIPTPAELMFKMGSSMKRHDWTNARRHLLCILNGLTNEVMKVNEELVNGKEFAINYAELESAAMPPLTPMEFQCIEDKLAASGWNLKSVGDFRNIYDSGARGTYTAFLAVSKV